MAATETAGAIMTKEQHGHIALGRHVWQYAVMASALGDVAGQIMKEEVKSGGEEDAAGGPQGDSRTEKRPGFGTAAAVSAAAAAPGEGIEVEDFPEDCFGGEDGKSRVDRSCLSDESVL
jgi:hypothetical protein